MTRFNPSRATATAIVLAASAATMACTPTNGRADDTSGPAAVSDAIAAAIAAPSRTAANVARDRYRHPAETLAFFGVKPGDEIVEIWPGGGWYSEILAPLSTSGGSKLTVVGPWPNGVASVRKLEQAHPAAFATIAYAAFPATDGAPKVADGSADVVLTFRNVHNWRFGGIDAAQANFNAMFAMLKPGGILGVVEHRLPEDMDSALEEKSGYMKKSSVIAFARAAGFEVAGDSDINANPRDTHDYKDGVWTLPPTYRLKDVDRAKYAAIGESDRMTLKFRKPR
ncbi:MAG: class I SAM-dependent methyltransferase [Sphingomonadales bacterium]|nr:class I SAM-dependent methyltransferase [Sphingomonadales bacterium]